MSVSVWSSLRKYSRNEAVFGKNIILVIHQETESRIKLKLSCNAPQIVSLDQASWYIWVPVYIYMNLVQKFIKYGH